jgi:hypothetical protein
MKTATYKKALFAALAVSAVAATTPALAQSYGYGYGQARELDRRQAQLEQRVERMAYNRQLSRNEFRVFERQFDQFDRMQWSYARNGLSRWEHAELSNQLDRIQSQIRYERREDRRDDRWRHGRG